MSWTTKNIEEITERRLIEDLKDEDGGRRFCLYESARNGLIIDVLSQIQA